MEDINNVTNTKKDLHTLASEKIYTGKVMGHKRGFGFLEHDEGDAIYLPHGIMKRVFHGDVIEVKVKSIGNGKLHVELLSIKSIEFKRMVGKVVLEEGQYYICPDHHRFYHNYFIPKYAVKGSRDGDYVVFERIDNPGDKRCKIKVVHVIGKTTTPGFEHQYALISNGLYDYAFNKEEVDNDFIVDVPEGYEDLRHIDFYTIDSEFSNDLDDAVYVESHEKGWNLYVAISDVAYHVEEDSGIDRKAKDLGQSVYMPGLSVSMFPDQIIQQSLSMLPNQDRLAMVMYAEIDNAGQISGYEFKSAVIRSKAKLNYADVSDYVEGWDQGRFANQYPDIAASVKALFGLHNEIKKDYSTQEEYQDYQIMIDFNSKKAVNIKQFVSGVANKMIETVMITYNTCFADFLCKNNMKAPYRGHGGLDESHREDAEWFMNMLLQKDVESLNDYEQYNQIKDYLKDQEIGCHYIEVMNQFLNKSAYSLEPKNHFGLGLTAYITATSPIRKYSDLVAQRVMHSILFNEQMHELTQEDIDQMNFAVSRVKDTSRFAEKLFKIQYVEDFLSTEDYRENVYDAKIVRIDRNGFMVKTVDHGLVGYIHKGTLKTKGEGFIYDHALKWAEDSGERYFMGKVVQVKILEANRQSQSVEMKIVE